MGPSIPTNFNNTAGLEDFARELGINVGVGFMVPAIVLSAILIFVFVKLCGGGDKNRQKFSNQQRYILLFASLLITVVCIVTCAVAWSYNNTIHNGVSSGTGTLQGVIDSSGELMNNVNASVADLKQDLMTEINSKSAPVVGNISNLMIPLNNIFNTISMAEDTLQEMTDLTADIVDNITIVKQDLAALNSVEGAGIIAGVPSPNEVPNVDSSYTNALNDSRNSLNDVVRNVRNMTNSVNDTMRAVNSTVTSRLFNLTNDYDQNANQILNYVNDFEAKITKTNNTFQDVSGDILRYSRMRRSVMAAILILPLVLSGLALAGVILRLKLLIKISAALCFVFMFWYFLAAGINYLAFYTIDQVCKNQDPLVSSALSIASEDITIPGSNVTIRVSEKVEQLLKCSGNNTLIDIFEFNFLIDDLTGQVANEIGSLTNQTNQLNQTDMYYQGLNNLTAMENTTVNLDFLRNSSLPTVYQDLANISDQVNNTINNPAYFSSLEAVNNITNNLLLTNGTMIHMYYDSTNITSLNCTADPYTEMSASDNADLCNKTAIAQAMTIFRDRTIAASGDVYGNITDIEQRLDGFNASLPRIYAYQNQTRGYAAQIRVNLDDTFYRTAAIISYVQGAAAAIIALIYQGTGQIIANTQCAYLGDAYHALSDNVCTDVRHSLEVITAMMVIGACMLFASTVVGMMTAHKLQRVYPNQE